MNRRSSLCSVWRYTLEPVVTFRHAVGCGSHRGLAKASALGIIFTVGASNSSLEAIPHKSKADLFVMHRHRVCGVVILAYENLRKLRQFFSRQRSDGLYDGGANRGSSSGQDQCRRPFSSPPRWHPRFYTS
jgi:hypothetical protein